MKAICRADDKRATSLRPPAERIGDFDEVAQPLDAASASEEASRCSSCGGCAECFQCVAACEPGAIDHAERVFDQETAVGAVVLAPGCEQFDPQLRVFELAAKKLDLQYDRDRNQFLPRLDIEAAYTRDFSVDGVSGSSSKLSSTRRV